MSYRKWHIVAIYMSIDVFVYYYRATSYISDFFSIIRLVISTDLLSWSLLLWYLSFFGRQSLINNKLRCTPLVYMKHSQTQITFWNSYMFLSWGGRIYLSTEFLETILLFLSYDSFIWTIMVNSPYCYGVLWKKTAISS